AEITSHLQEATDDYIRQGTRDALGTARGGRAVAAHRVRQVPRDTRLDVCGARLAAGPQRHLCRDELRDGTAHGRLGASAGNWRAAWKVARARRGPAASF